ncbi:MAG: glycosyltransferase family 2 protein [Oscillospiraceae bacterium]|jgi:glycosyltransferase involved in cell wall biosynthesis|nr:glycosyltransferase family 2 protein [Oscillospiraceae bacterium]
MLSVAVIGRNEARGLGACLASVDEALKGLDHEVLYVDSGSTDASMAIALAAGARCYRLCTRHPTAGLGRRVGALEARGEHILFLDGDMLLSAGFAQDALAEMSQSGWDGAVGVRRDLYERNGVLDEAHPHDVGPVVLCEASSFGGAVLLRREALLTAGNWAAGVIAREEDELYARLLSSGARVVSLPVPMATHIDRVRDNRGLWTLLTSPRRLGLGQAIRHAFRARSLVALLPRVWESLACWLADALCLVALCIWGGAAFSPAVLAQASQLLWFRFAPQGMRGYAAQKLLFFALPAGFFALRTPDEAYEAVTP